MALGSLKLGARKSAEFSEVFRTEVWFLLLLPMRPQVLDRIEFWRVGRREFKLYAAAFAFDIVARQTAAMSLPPIPDDKHLAGSKVVAEVFDEGDEIGCAHGAF